MKSIFLSAALIYSFITALALSPHPAQASSFENITVSTVLDVGSKTVEISGQNYAYIMGSRQALNTHLNPAGKTNIVNLTGYFTTLDGETTFVIIKIEVVGMQG